nr:hypothetical protein [Rhodoferax sp.]
MGKLFKLKSWLTLQETANHLSILFGEPVTETDILRLALDGKLKLSAVFVGGAWASFCKPVDDADIRYKEVPTLDGVGVLKIPIGGQITYAANGQTLQSQEEVFSLDSDEPYDLVMMGGEHDDIEFQYWQSAGGPRIETTNMHGTWVSQGQKVFQLKGKLPGKNHKPTSFYPLGGLPKDVAIVVTPSALLALEKSIGDGVVKEEKPLTTRERDTLLKLVIGMAVDGYGHDPAAAKSNVPKEVADILANLGMSVSDDTVRKYLKQAADTVLPAKPRQS